MHMQQFVSFLRWSVKADVAVFFPAYRGKTFCPAQNEKLALLLQVRSQPACGQPVRPLASGGPTGLDDGRKTGHSSGGAQDGPDRC